MRTSLAVTALIALLFSSCSSDPRQDDSADTTAEAIAGLTVDPDEQPWFACDGVVFDGLTLDDQNLPNNDDLPTYDRTSVVYITPTTESDGAEDDYHLDVSMALYVADDGARAYVQFPDPETGDVGFGIIYNSPLTINEVLEQIEAADLDWVKSIRACDPGDVKP